MKRWLVLLTAVILAVVATCAWAQSPAAGPNVNMVSGTDWTTGDPFLQRQNEPSVAVSTRNTSHLLAGANDYRSVDFEELFPDVNGEQTPDAWLGVFKSFDGGATWASTLLPGFPADGSTAGRSSPLFGLQAAADPIVRAGTNGMFYYAGIGFNRTNNLGKVFVARFIDNNNKENGDPTNLQTPGLFTAVSPTDPIRYLGTNVVQSGTASQFLDKPWLAVDVPRGSATCKISYTNPDGTTGTQTIPASNIYLTFSDFVNSNTQSAILFTRSTNCGATWSAPVALSPLAVNQGSVIAVAPPIPGTESLLPPLVYVAWRRFGSGNTPGAIMMAESLNGGASFTPAYAAHTFPLSCNTTPTGAGCPFDQGITGTSFRTNTYPAMAADTTGRVYLAWTQRQANGDARIMMQVGLVGIPLPPPVLVDNGPVLDDNGNPLSNLSGRGHQVMPSLTFNAGKLMLLYYDLRQDHTIGQFTPLANETGYSETRLFEGELTSGDPADPSVFNFWVDDAGAPPTHPLTTRRHTIDVQAAQATPGAPLNFAVPAFTAFRVAHYEFGINPYDNSSLAEQLEVNPPNLPMFQQGHAPFMGDYIDVAGAPTFVLTSGKWHFNTSTAAGLPVFQAVWTDNRNVRPPLNGDWTQYTPPYSASNPSGGTTSKFDPTKTTITCNPEFVASRNQDVYTSRIAPGLVVSVPGNQKTLGNAPNTSTLLQRAFSVVVQNTTTLLKSFRLTIANQPLLANGSVDPLGQATFQQLPPTPTVTTLDVQVNPLSSISRMVFVKSQNPTASVTVNVQQITAPGGTVVSGGLTSTTVINPDPTTPPIINPDNPSVGNPSIGNSEVYNPSVGNPSIGNPSIGNTALLNPSIGNPSVGNPSIGNPSVGNQAFATALNPSVGNPSIGNPSIGNPSIGNPSIGNQSVTDASYSLTNTGNTTATYSVKLFGPTLPTSLLYQLILNKVYYLNQIGPDGCTLQQQPTNVILSNIPNPPIVTDPSTLGNPSVGNPSVGNATVAVPPGETVQVTLRISPGGNLPFLTPDQVQQQVLNNVTPVAVSHATNTQSLGNPNPQPPLSLTITTKILPNAGTNVAYSQQLVAIGGVVNPPTPNYTWSLTGDSSLPPNLSLSSSGLISGTPTTAGTYSFTVRVADAATPTPHIAQQALSILVIAPLAFTPPATQMAVMNSPFSEDLSSYTSGGVPPFTFGATGLTAPFSLTGSVISGTPTVAGSVGPFTLKVTDSANQSQSSMQTINIINPVSINSITPSTAADGFGQLITIFTTGVPDPTQAAVTFTQGTFSAAGFVFPSPSSANVLYVRLPSGLTTGPTNVVVTNTSTTVSSAPFPITVSTTPGTPVANFVYGLSTPPAPANNNCGAGLSGSPVTTATVGQGIVVSGYGIDTQYSSVVFSDGTHAISVASGCALTNSTLGVGLVVTVPAGLNAGPITVSLQTAVNNVNSALSNPISLTLIVPPSATVTTLSSTTNPSALNQYVPLTATVTDTSSNPVPSGSVTFMDGNTVLASGVPMTANGTASTSAGFTSNGTHNLSAQYVPAGNYLGSSGNLVQNVASPAFTDFSTFNYVSANGTANQSGNVLNLTQAQSGQVGSAWFSVPQPVIYGFTTTFQFQVTNGAGDGFAFVIQNDPHMTAALGAAGGSMGYGASSDHSACTTGGACNMSGGIVDSVAIEFDTFDNQYPSASYDTSLGDPDNHHLAVQSCGPGQANSPAHVAPNWQNGTSGNAGFPNCLVGGNISSVPAIADGNVHTVQITYTQGGNLILTYDGNTTVNAGITLSNLMNLLNGTSAYVGFTGATGAATESVNILNWTFTPYTTSNVTVQATDVIYAAGSQTSVAAGAGGTVPGAISLLSNASSVSFSVQGSLTSACASSQGCISINIGTGSNQNDPDGTGAATSTSSNNGSGSISGIAAPGAGYLVGVFIGAGGPSGTPPSALDFTPSGLGTSFAALSPQLNQVFFIGDGLTGDGTGTMQTFFVPTGATQLYLGISDASFYAGDPSAYSDNAGAYSVTYVVTNAP